MWKATFLIQLFVVGIWAVSAFGSRFCEQGVSLAGLELPRGNSVGIHSSAQGAGVPHFQPLFLPVAFVIIIVATGSVGGEGAFAVALTRFP